MSEWSTTKVRDVAVRVTKGTTPTTLGGKFVDEGIHFVKAESITDDGRIDVSRLAFIDEPSHMMLSRSVLEEDDVLFTIAGTVGRVAQVSKNILPANTNQAVAIIRPDCEVIEPRFLYYALRDEQRVMDAHSRIVQSVQANFSLSELAGLEIPFPEKSEQQEIVGVLGTLDDKIEVNRRMAVTLEDIARAIFKSWFVDFDPVRTKMEGRDPSGVDVHTATAFPERLTVSDLGEIPEGWKVGSIDDLVSISRNAINPLNAPDDLFDHYSIPAFDEAKRPVRQRGEEIRSNKFLIKEGCVLVSRLNPRIQRVWLPDPADDVQSVCSTEFAVALPLPPFTTEFMYGLLSSFGFQEQFATLVTGTSGSHQRVKPADLQQMPVVIPDPSIVHVFTEVVAPVLMRISRNGAESATLAALRDLLLPKLISGEIRIRDAEHMAEAAL